MLVIKPKYSNLSSKIRLAVIYNYGRDKKSLITNICWFSI